MQVLGHFLQCIQAVILVWKKITEVLLESSTTLTAKASFCFLNFNTSCNMSNIISSWRLKIEAQKDKVATNLGGPARKPRT